MSSDSDDPSVPDDHGLNMDSASASHDNPSNNSDLILATNDNPCIHPGPSTSQQSSATVLSDHVRCVNCGINVSRMRRHLLEIAEVRLLIQRWVQPQQAQVASDDVVCHSCWTSAWDQIRQSTSQGLTERIVGHLQVCISCGRSLLRQRSHRLRNDTQRENRIRDMVIHQIAPRELPSLAQLCHTCWRRIDRAASRFTEEQSSHSSLLSLETEHVNRVLPQPTQDTTGGSGDIFMPNYVRAPATQRQCFFPGCNGAERLLVPSTLRVNLLCTYNYYVPTDCRICRYHLRSNSWHLLLQSITNPIKTFSAEQLEELVSLLRDNMLMHLDFENIHNLPEHIVHYYLGFSIDQFDQILAEVPRLANRHRGAFALAAYLMKLRTGDSDQRISALLQVPRSTLEGLMIRAREILHQDFVPRNLGINHITRTEIAQRNLLIPNGLYGGEERSPIIIADGTYIYIEKSSNYLYQKKTYSLHKYRNLIKPFLLVCSDGYIIDVLGPYPATTTDADIINNEFMDENSQFRRYFQAGDVFILDRGFRDSLSLLRNCNYQVHVPLSLDEGETQLSTSQANQSRAVTLCRWVVEVVNGIFKTAFKIFRQNFFNRASKHVMIDFSVAAALTNKFHTKIRDRQDAAQILEIVRHNMNRNNDLSDYVRQHNLNGARADFQNINVDAENVRNFPTLTESDLILIACGTYQLKQARSYYGEHIRFDGCYRIEICRDGRNRTVDPNYFGPNCFLIRAKIASRHVSHKIYFVYILTSGADTGRAAIKQYCCNCIVGRRTVGCCAHVMTVIWYLGWARHQPNVNPPAQFLDDVLVVYDTLDEN